MSCGQVFRMVLAFAVLLFTGAGASAEVLELDSAPAINLNKYLVFAEDRAASQSIHDILSSPPQWQSHSADAFNRGYNASAWWLKLDVSNTLDQDQERLLEVAYAVLDYVDFYLVDGERVVGEYHTGDKRVFSSRPKNSRMYVFPIEWQARQNLTLYLRIQSSSSVQAPLTLWQADSYAEHATMNNTQQGLYFGAMGAIIIYNLLIYFALRDRSYIYYVGFAASLPLFFASLNGFAFQYLWPQSLRWNNHAIPIFISCSILFGALFTREILQLRRVSKTLNRVITFFAITGLLMLLAAFVLPYKTTILFLVPLAILACLGDISAGVYCWLRHIGPARSYVVAWACFLVGTIIFTLNKVDVLPANMVTEHAIQFGSVLEAVLLSFALAERINTEKKLRFEAQEKSLEAQRLLTEDLEQRVQERTAELAQLNEKLQELVNIDPLTQLHNRRHLEAVGYEEWRRCLRHQHPISVLMLDVDHFKEINDRYGHAVGDTCLQQVAEIIRCSLRDPTDIAARYGGEEFCIVLPYASAEGAGNVAERIREEIAGHSMGSGESAFSITVSIGICSALPCADSHLDQVLDNADRALYRSKSRGRNRVSFYHGSDDETALASS